jgi:adhesin transport system outer membrane protein
MAFKKIPLLNYRIVFTIRRIFVKTYDFSLKLSTWLFILPGLVFASETANSQSLSDAIRSALAQYPTIIAAQARLEASRSDITRAQGQHYPQISWQGTTSNYSGVNANGGAAASGLLPDNTWIQSPQVTLNIWSGGRIQADVDRSTSQSIARLQQQRLTRDEVALLALEGYLNWARSIELVSLARTNVNTHRRILNDVKKITAVDQGRMIDQDQAEVRLENAELILKQRETELAVSAQRLERMLMGALPAKPVGVDLIRGEIPTSAKAAVAYINDLHPAIAVQLAQIGAARASLDSARSQFSPTVNLSYGKQFTQGSGQGDYITQLTFNVPIFSGGSTYGAVGSASNELLATQQGLAEARLLLTERVLSIWPELQASRSRKELAQRQAQTGVKLVQGYEQQFRIGRRSLLDLLIIQNDLYGYQSSATIAAYDERIAKGRMLAAIGKLAAAYYGEQKDGLPNTRALTNQDMPQTSGSLLRAQPNSVKPTAP